MTLLYAYTASKARLLFWSKSVQNTIHKATGSVMIASDTVLLFKI